MAVEKLPRKNLNGGGKKVPRKITRAGEISEKNSRAAEKSPKILPRKQKTCACDRNCRNNFNFSDTNAYIITTGDNKIMFSRHLLRTCPGSSIFPKTAPCSLMRLVRERVSRPYSAGTLCFLSQSPRLWKLFQWEWSAE